MKKCLKAWAYAARKRKCSGGACRCFLNCVFYRRTNVFFVWKSRILCLHTPLSRMYTWVFSARATAFRFTPPYRDSAALFSARWLSCAATFLYKLSFLRVQNVFFENQSNAVEFCRRHILPPEKEVVLHGAGVDLNHAISTRRIPLTIRRDSCSSAV